MADAIALSIVLTGRNDNYGGDFNARLVRAVRFNWAALRDRGVSCEIVLVEWNPVQTKPMLSDVARSELSDIPADRFVSYIVDARYQEACSQNARLRYLEFPAKNVGIRRARGRHILATNTDVFFSRGVIEAVATGLEDGTIYRAARIDLAIGSDQTRVTWDALEDSAGHERRPTLAPPLYAGGTGDFLLLDRTSWHQLRGFNEIYRGARLGIDHNFLVKAYGCSYRITDIGSPVFHVNHVGSFRISRHAVQGEASDASWGNRRWHSRRVVYDNPDHWGLDRAPERELATGARFLEFDWEAVPPIVDLRRVVVPLKRPGTAPDSAASVTQKIDAVKDPEDFGQ